jgi:hypothetical protein
MKSTVSIGSTPERVVAFENLERAIDRQSFYGMTAPGSGRRAKKRVVDCLFGGLDARATTKLSI